MADQLVHIADGFWNVRGSFKVAGLLNVGTQTSLVRLRSGDFVLLDSYKLTGKVAQQVFALTQGGRAVRAILNLHPFHTTHVAASAEQFPNALLYGTRRHKERAPTLPWQAQHTEDAALHQLFRDDISFSVPRGVDFISKDQRCHFSSVLALHKASSTLHVDDTLSWSNLPIMRGLKFHPTLRMALQKRAGAAAEFREWAKELIASCDSVRQLCTAHMQPLPNSEHSVGERVRAALIDVSGLLDAHARRFG